MTQDKKQTAAEAESQFIGRIGEVVSGAVTQALKPVQEQMTALEERIVTMEESDRNYSLPGSNEETHKGEEYSFAKVCAGLAAGDVERFAPMEFAMSEELREKQFAAPQGTTPDDLGGFLVPNEVHNEMLIPLLKDRIIATQLGMTVMSDAKGIPVEIPMVASETSPEGVAENQGTPDSNITFNMLQMTPKTCQVYLVSSRRFLQMGTGAEGIVRGIIADNLSREYNKWALTGTGADGQPVGILNTSGIGTHTWSAAVGSSGCYNELVQMDGVLADAKIYEDGSTPTWVVPYQFVRMLQQMTSGNATAGTENLEINRKVFTKKDQDAIINRPYVQTGLLAGGTDPEVLLGVWKHMIMAQWGGMRLEASNVAGEAMRKRQTHIVAYTDIDYGVRYPEAFVLTDPGNISAF